MTVQLIESPADLAEFASDLATIVREEGRRLTAKDLAEAYLDQNLADEQDFETAVKEFTSQCEYYAG